VVSDPTGSVPLHSGPSRRKRGHAAPAARVLTVGLSLAATCTIITALAMEQPPVVASSVDEGAALPASTELAELTPTTAPVAIAASVGDPTSGLGGSAPVGVQPISVPSNRSPVPSSPAPATPSPTAAPAPAPVTAPAVAPTPTTPRVVTPPTTVARTRAS
jgi:hypothetical protein